MREARLRACWNLNSMNRPDALNDTANDHERLETELVAQDRDVARVSAADIDETTAQQIVSELVDAGVVIAVPDQRVLVHEPSGEAFDSIRQFAVFHRGWVAARDADENDQ